MDRGLIERIAGAETARKLCDAKAYDAIVSKAPREEIKGNDLNGLLKGAAVLGADPIGTVTGTAIDGLFLYFRLKTGEVIGVQIEAPESAFDVIEYGALTVNKINI